MFKTTTKSREDINLLWIYFYIHYFIYCCCNILINCVHNKWRDFYCFEHFINCGVSDFSSACTYIKLLEISRCAVLDFLECSVECGKT